MRDRGQMCKALWTKAIFEFRSNDSGKPLGCFKQKSDMVWFVFSKPVFGCSTENELQEE